MTEPLTPERTRLRADLVTVLDNANQTHPCPVTGSAYWTGCYHPDGTGLTCHSGRRADAVLTVLDAEVERVVRVSADWLEGIGQDHAAAMLRYSLDLGNEMEKASAPAPTATPADRDKAPWGRAEDGRPLLPEGAHWTDVPEMVDRTLATIQARVDQAQPGHWYEAPATETGLPSGTVRTRVDGYPRTVGQIANMLPADRELVLHAHDDLTWCLDMIAKFRATATPQPEAEADPVPLRWGLDDVMYGDDDTTTLLLSGPDLEPYWLELDPERTAALQDCLTGPGEHAVEPLTVRQEHVLALIRSSRGDGIWGTGDLVPLYRAWHTRNTRGEARRDLYALKQAGHLTRLGPDHAVRYRLTTPSGGA